MNISPHRAEAVEKSEPLGPRVAVRKWKLNETQGIAVRHTKRVGENRGIAQIDYPQILDEAMTILDSALRFGPFCNLAKSLPSP